MKLRSKKCVRVAGLLAGAVVGAYAMSVSAAPILSPITATLTGDIRQANPDGILINVTVTPVSPTQVSWVIDLDMAATHPNAKLDEFYFNLDGSAGDYSFSNFNPGSWTVSTPADVQGAGGADFMFEIGDPPPGPPVNVTNFQSLTFDMTKTSGNFMLEDFLFAPVSTSNDAGSGELGAHVQSLGPTGAASGFAFGAFVGSGNPPPPVPEPATLSLLGFGLAGVGGLLYRRRRQQA